MAHPVQRNLDTAEIHMKNCGVWTEWRQSLGPEFEVQQSVSIEAQATATESGAVAEIPEELRAKLAMEVELAYQQTFEAARSEQNQIELVAGPNTDYVYVILWVEKKFASTVSFSMNGIAYTAPYTYTLCVPTQAGFRELGCSG